MSSHYKFEIHIRTPGETDDEQQEAERFAQHIRETYRYWYPHYREFGLDITVGDVERT